MSSIMKAIALYDFRANEAEGNELSLKKNDILDVIEQQGDWWKVKNTFGKYGLVPVAYVAGPVDSETKILSRGKTKDIHVGSSQEELSIGKGSQVAILDNDDDYWWYVAFSGKTGYIPKHIIQLFNKKQKQKEPAGGEYELTGIVPDKALCDENATVLFSFAKALPDNGKFMVVFKGEHCEKVVDAERLNDFTLTTVTPKYFPPECTKVMVNYQEKGKASVTIVKGFAFSFQSKLDVVHKILKTESDPMNFLCSAFKVEHGDVQNVDYVLSGILEKKIPEGFSVLKSNTNVQSDAHPKETPTLLHFAAFYNLKKLTKTLLKCPGAPEALMEKNCQGMGPSEIAKFKKYDELEKILVDHQDEISEADFNENYEAMERIYEKYIEMDGGYVRARNDRRVPRNEDDQELYEDMEGAQAPEEHYDTPRTVEDDEHYDDIDGEGKGREAKNKDLEEYMKFGRMTEKEVQLALLMKRVKERYITQEQALEMAKVLRLEPQVNTTTVAKKPKIFKKKSAPHIDELNRKVKSLPRTMSTSSGSSMSSVSSTGSAGSSGSMERPQFKQLPPTPGPPKKPPARVPVPARRKDGPPVPVRRPQKK